jgi:hypothetical protein
MDDFLIFVSPAYVLALFIASAYGLVFFLFLGQGWRQLFLFWGVAVAAFLIGQGIARTVGLSLFNIGAVNLVEGIVASTLGLIAARTWGRV